MAVNETGPAPAAPAPNVRELVTVLARAQVRFVLTGSVAAAAWTGRAGELGDLDIAPDLEPGNLARLARLLAALQARPVHRPEWKRTLSPEACSRWRPDPPTEEQLDHQLATAWGPLDVLPRRSGEYAMLTLRGHTVRARGVEVRVADPDDLIATLRPDREAKHRRRLDELRALRRQRPAASPRGLEFLTAEEC